MKKKFVAGFVPAVLILVFIYTGTNKLFGIDNFASSLYNQPIPHGLAFFLSRAIPIVEIATAASLFFPSTQKPGLYASFVLLTVFTGYIAAILLHFFRKMPCSCAGIFRHITWQQHLYINLALLLLTGLALVPAIKKRFHSPLNHSI